MSEEAPALRVAFVEYDLRLGGGVVFVLDLASELMRRGVVCHVFSVIARSSMAEDFARLQIPTTFGGEDKYSILEDRLSRLLEAMAEFAPTSIVVGANPQTCEILRYVPPALQRIAVFHLVLREHLDLAGIYREFFQFAVGVSRLAAQTLQEVLGREPPQVRCIELGVHRPARERSPAPPGAPLRILYVGRLEQTVKRVRLFPAILRQLREGGVPFVWTIAGEGEERAYLEAEMRGEPGTEVVFRGLVPRRDIQALLAANDVFLLASVTEAYPLGLHEAMAAGLVPVVSDIPGRIREIVTPATGSLVALDDVEGYAEAIVALHHDRADLASKSLAAQRIIGPECTVEGMADRWLSLLREAPAVPAGKGRWLRPRAPLGLKHRLRYSPVGRWARRWGARLSRLICEGSLGRADGRRDKLS